MVRDRLPEYGSVTATAEAVGPQLGNSRETFRRWVAHADIDDGRRAGVSSTELEEIARLRAENERLRDTNEVLRRAEVFFAGELDPQG